MVTVPGYSITETLHVGKRTAVYRGTEDSTGKRVVIKVPAVEYPTLKEVARWRHAHAIATLLGGDETNSIAKGVVKHIATERWGNGIALIIEDFSGESIARLYAKRPMEIGAFLRLAIALTDVVGMIHSKRVIHKDLSPHHIIYHPQTGELKLTGFGYSSALSVQRQTVASSEAIEGSLLYMSPEQTGRMNRILDSRGDLYSLGVIFYELLTGKPPFEGDDPLELIHAHIARRPVSPTELNPAIPSVVSDIILKLLSKMAEDRYHGAMGLKVDLETCLLQWEKTRSISQFIPGARDMPDRLHVVQTLYGRENETTQLLAAFERVSEGGNEMILVSGDPGIGKSSLVQEIQKPVVRQRAFFITGKTDINRRSIPYSSMIQAFQDLVRQLLTRPESEISAWRAAILRETGANAGIIADVIPEIKSVIGEQPPIPALGPTETQNRFLLVFQKFIGVFATRDHPLVIFLDDLQWIDADSLKLLRLLMSAQIKQFLVIGAYRENEVSAYHSLSLTLEELRTAGVPMTHLHLSPLDERKTTLLIRDTFQCETAIAKPFGAVVYRKTGGNPFFINAFLESLAQDEDVRFDYTRQAWIWDLGAIERRNVTDNVLDLILNKVRALPPGTQKALAVAALIGNRFDLRVLAHVMGLAEPAAAADLWHALQENIIIPLDDSFQFVESYYRDGAFGELPAGTRHISVRYKFSHDRVQQAIFAAIPKERAEILHLEIGRALLKPAQPDQQNEFIFDIVNHFNAGIEQVKEKNELDEIIRFNTIAGTRAQSSTAFQQAYIYFDTAATVASRVNLTWTTDPVRLFEIHLQRGENAFLSGQLELAEAAFELCIAHASVKTAAASVYAVKVQLSIHRNQFDDAFDAALKGLRLVGVTLPSKPGKLSVLPPLIGVQLRLLGKSTGKLRDMHNMNDENAIAALNILMNMIPAAYFKGPEMLFSIILMMMRLTLIHGNAPASSYGFALYGLIIGSAMGNYKKGYEFGKLSLEIAARFNDKLLHGRANEVFSSAINHWRAPLATNEPYLSEGLHECLESGDLVYAMYIAYFAMTDKLFGKYPLDQLETDIKGHEDLKLRMQYADKVDFGIRPFIKTMQNGAIADATSTGAEQREEAFDVDALMNGPYAAKNNLAEMQLFIILKIKSLYFFGDARESLRIARDAEKYQHAIFGQYVCAEYSFFAALAAAANLGSVEQKERKSLRAFLKTHQKKIVQWAKNCPENFEHKSLLVAAEVARAEKHNELSAKLYDQAIASTKGQGFVQNEALACECAARFHLSQGHDAVALPYIADARYAYMQWGAMAKATALESEFAKLLVNEIPSGIKNSSVEPTSANNLDAQTVVKSSRILSSQIMLPNLLESLMRIVLESAGAERGALMMETNGTLYIETEGYVNPERIVVMGGVPVTESGKVPLSVVNYVVRTSESVILDNALNDRSFGDDPYIRSRNVHSLLCIPLVNQATMTGVLYLENAFTVGAFTAARVEMLRVLSAQAAVSITNARLYKQMEEYNKTLETNVQQRTQDLQFKSEELARNNLALESEKERSNDLLHNILPVDVARELIEKGTTTPTRYESVTIVMTDFKEFTRSASEMTPRQLVEELNEIFSVFDDIVARHDVEKVKTIGDAYMFAGGLPNPAPDHPVRCVRAAIEMLQFLESRNARASNANAIKPWEMRVGVNTGPIVAGVVGKRKFTYDVWGDTVNIASRMETLGEPGRINVSASTYQEIKSVIPCVPRGNLPVKGKGEIEMYFVDMASYRK